MEPDLTDVEELTLCNFCKQKFNTTDLCPKMLQCKHYFCLKCVETTMVKGREVFCVHCWKRTEVSDSGAASLQTHTPILSLANHLTALHINGSDRVFDKDKMSEGENCHVHGMPHSMWCHTCRKALCRACVMRAEHPGHVLKTQTEAKDLLVNEVQLELSAMNKILLEIQRLTIHQREFLLKVLEACVALKTCVESDLQMGSSAAPELADSKELLAKAKAALQHITTPGDASHLQLSLTTEKQRLEGRYHELLLQCKLDDLIGSSGVVFDFQLLTQALQNIQNSDWILPRSSPGVHNPILFLTNYCMSQLYSRYVISKSQNHLDLLQSKINQNNDYYVPNKFDLMNDNVKSELLQNGAFVSKPQDFLPIKTDLKSKFELSPPLTLLRNPGATYPMYYFNIDMNQSFLGRIVIETRPDVAPKMSKNFAALCTGETGVSYKNCAIFQCWEGESIITGDYESNNGRGGRSIYEEGFFMPDETKIPSVRGAVGMRRTQKRHDNLGMVGSQFRVILQEMRGFTAIFGHVVEGIDVIEKIASCGDQTGKPTKSIVITSCGKL